MLYFDDLDCHSDNLIFNMTSVNSLAPTIVTKYIIPIMKNRKEKSGIIFQGSMNSDISMPYMPLYSATKGFLKNLSVAMYYEL
jgi:short-subunit dehydrogenase